MSVPVISALALMLSTLNPGNAAHGLAWQAQDTGSTARLRGLAPISHQVAWASGSAGTVLRTLDGGQSWAQVGPPDAAALQFRDIEAFDARNAVILSIGTGEDSRVYLTGNGGASWTEAFRNTDPDAFYDCMSFFDRSHGLALSDPVGGKFRILSTSDSGRSWQVVSGSGMPAALEGEFAFAASGTCLTTVKGSSDAWFATGGGATARVFHSRDRGRTWTVADTPVPSGPTAGIYSVAFRDQWHGIAVGGDFTTPQAAPSGAAVTSDGGRTWREAGRVPGEYRSGSAFLPLIGNVAFAVGPTGSDVTVDSGRHWTRFDQGSFDAVGCAPDLSCWASGESGRIARLTVTQV